MKSRYLQIKLLILMIVSIGWFIPAHAQQTTDLTFKKIEAAIKTNDFKTLATFFNTNVEIIIGEKEDTYAKLQAQFVIEEFFISYPQRSFSILHKGSTAGNFYAVGSYISTRGTFDTNIFIKKYGENFLIDQIRFEKDK